MIKKFTEENEFDKMLTISYEDLNWFFHKKFSIYEINNFLNYETNNFLNRGDVLNYCCLVLRYSYCKTNEDQILVKKLLFNINNIIINNKRKKT